MAVSSFRDLLVWQKACDLAEAVHVTAKRFPREELYGLAAQMRRSSASVSANIAEGAGRGSSAEFCYHIGVALGSLYETRTWIELARRFGYLSPQETQTLDSLADEVGAMLHALRAKLRARK